MPNNGPTTRQMSNSSKSSSHSSHNNSITQRNASKENSSSFHFTHNENTNSSSSVPATEGASQPDSFSEFRNFMASFTSVVMPQLNRMESKLDDIESKYEHLLQRTTQHDHDISDMKKDIQQLEELHASVSEQQDRLSRINNIVVMGVPENDKAISTLQNLFALLLPGSNLCIANERRIGAPAPGKVRPCRVTLNNSNDVHAVLRSTNLAKSHPLFSTFSIKKDETRQQKIDKHDRWVARQNMQSQPQSNNPQQPFVFAGSSQAVYPHHHQSQHPVLPSSNPPFLSTARRSASHRSSLPRRLNSVKAGSKRSAQHLPTYSFVPPEKNARTSPTSTIQQQVEVSSPDQAELITMD